VSDFNTIATDIILEWTKDNINEILIGGAISIAAVIIGKFIIWPKLVELWDRINGR